MKTENEYWLYLEPYSFVFSGANRTIVYNTLNGEVIDVPVNSYMQSIMDELLDATNGYCVPIESFCLDKQEMLQFFRKLRNTFSGDVLKIMGSKPFIIPPVCHIVENQERMMKENEASSRRYIMNNLSEISLFFSSDCTAFPSYSKQDYVYQHLHCVHFTGESLDYSYYRRLFQNIKFLKVGTVNILCENVGAYKDWALLCHDLKELNVKKNIYLEYSDQITINSVNNLQVDDNTHIRINVYSPYNEALLVKYIKELKGRNLKVEWAFGVKSEDELNQASKIISSFEISSSMFPLLADGNIEFFEKYVYNSYEDIIEYPISKQTIFRRQTLNENFFGKLFVLPSGEVYANLNCKSLGNIKENSLNEMVYNEMINSTAWFMTRDKGICQDCVYRYLCPSISNYELALGKMNMCHVCKLSV